VTKGLGIHASFDPIGEDFMDRYAGAMAKNGILFLYGGLTGTYANPPFLKMIQRSLWFHPYSLFNYVEDPEACHRGKTFVYSALSEGKLKLNIDKIFPMDGFVDAWRYLKSERKNHGKVVIKTGA
ncbi:MAG: zinc-binding dehydrogenase, partial [Paracoccaceae bacterium]